LWSQGVVDELYAKIERLEDLTDRLERRIGRVEDCVLPPADRD
jgi:hypothetical protein